MKARPVVMYIGGFAKVGGIEAFTRDLLLGLAPFHPHRELVMWGRADKDHRLLEEIIESGVKITRSPWRWGCVWNLPDYLLAPLGVRVVRRAAAVFFKRPPPIRIMRFLRWASRNAGRHIPFILVTPYRPGEYFSKSTAYEACRSFDVITVQSEEGVRDLKGFGYRGRIENIPLLPPRGTELVPFPANQGSGVIRLGFLGRLVAQKNLPYLLDVFSELAKKSKGSTRFELHLFGDGAERQQLEQRCTDQDEAGVVFHGEIPRDEISQAIDSCDLFLITSVTEGQCLVALEVLNRGRALVATPVGSLPEILQDSDLGRLAPLHQPADFATAVVEVAESVQAGRTTPASVAAAFRARYDYDAVLRQYLALLAEPEVEAAPQVCADPVATR